MPKIPKLVQILLLLMAIGFTTTMILWLRSVGQQQTELDKSTAALGRQSYEIYKSQKEASKSFSDFQSGQQVPTTELNKPGILADRTITITKIEPYSHPMMKSYYEEPGGFALDIVIENNGTSPLAISPSHFIVQDSDSRPFTYFDVHPGGKRPPIEPLTEVAPGQKLRGYISYVGTGKPSVIYYNSKDGSMLKFIL